MRILVTNDDGIEAPGLAALELVCRQWGEVLTIAPDRHLSGCSHQATTDRPLRLSEMAPRRYALDGTPVDCVRVGLSHHAPDIDLVVSGINDGGNLGSDVFISGTVAAAREAALLGKNGVAISRYRRTRGTIDWAVAAEWTRRVLKVILAEPPRPRTFWNVNLPDPIDHAHIPKIARCAVDPHALPVRYDASDAGLHYGGVYKDRRRETGHDVDVCFNGDIAVSRIKLDLLVHSDE